MGPYRDPPSPSRRCPRCATGLTRRALADAHIDECLGCGGVFVANELLPRVVDGLDLGGEVISTFPPGTPEPPGATPIYLKCPRCAGVMTRKLFATGAKIIIDRCPPHGIWFDDAELRAVALFASGGGLERAASQDADHAAQRAAQARRAAARAPLALSHPSTELERTSVLEVILDFLTFW